VITNHPILELWRDRIERSDKFIMALGTITESGNFWVCNVRSPIRYQGVTVYQCVNCTAVSLSFSCDLSPQLYWYG